jgi:hypothetical protein
LRTNQYFYEARVRPIAFQDGRVDVEVLTRDVWTLRPGISFGRQGGANTTSIDISELNLFGTGAGIRLAHSSTPDRNEDTVSFASTHVGGTWLRTELLLSNNSDGRKRSALSTAFCIVTGPPAKFRGRRRIDTLYGGGHRQDFRRMRKQECLGVVGRSEGRWVKRYVRIHTDESRFAPATPSPIRPIGSGVPMGRHELQKMSSRRKTATRSRGPRIFTWEIAIARRWVTRVPVSAPTARQSSLTASLGQVSRPRNPRPCSWIVPPMDGSRADRCGTRP